MNENEALQATLALEQADAGSDPYKLGIRILLVGGTALLVMFALRRQSLLFHRMIGVLLFFAIALAVLFPGITMTVAHLLGVGRGTDLIVYVSFLLFSFLSLLAFQRIDASQKQITILTRALAHETAQRPASDGQTGNESEPVRAETDAP